MEGLNRKGTDIYMKEILELLPILAIAIIMNIGAGLYYNIGTKKLSFDNKILLAGFAKAAIVAGIFMGSAFCFEATDLSALGISPDLIMTSAIALYVGKAVMSLCRILGIEVK